MRNLRNLRNSRGCSVVREYGKKGRKARNWEEKACFLRKKHKKGQKNLVVSQKSITFAANFWKEVYFMGKIMWTSNTLILHTQRRAVSAKIE